MTLTSTIDIDLNDSKFSRFKELFDKYDEALKKQPELWKKLGALQQITAKSFDAMSKGLGDVADEIRAIGDETGKQNNALRQSERLWVSMARSGKELGSSILSSTVSLAKWTGILGLIGGVFGGIFGVGHLINDVSGLRRSAMGRGIRDTGKQQAFDVNFDRFVDTGSFLDNVAEMEQDRRLQTPGFVGLGRGLSGNTTEDAKALLRRGFAVAHGTSDVGNLATSFQAAGLDGLFDPAARLNLHTTGAAEFEAQLNANKKDEKTMSIQEKVALDYANAATAIKRFTANTEATAAKVFDPLVQKIPAVLDEMTKLISKLGELIDNFGLISDFINGILHPGKTLDKFNKFDAAFTKDATNWFQDTFYPDAKFPGLAGAGSKSSPGWGAGLGDFGITDFVKSLWHAGERSDVKGGAGVSPKGAMGPGQFMPGTWKDYGRGGDINNPADAAAASARMSADLYKQFHGDAASMFAAYNAGPDKVSKAQSKYGIDWLNHLPAETQAYVGRSMVYIMNQTGGSCTVAACQVGGQ